MRRKQPFAIPDEAAFWNFFQGPPIESAPEDGFWCYETTDADNVTLRLSINVHLKSVQTTLSRGLQHLCTVVQEGAERLDFVQESEVERLKGEFEYGVAYAAVEIQVHPYISVRWSTLLSPE